MKNQQFIVKICFIGISILLMIVVFSCGQKKDTNKTSEKESDIIQADFFNSYHEGLCYSGFRSGQHPDRGFGAVNPSYSEVLEDFKIIENDLGIHLIRLYDCNENTQMTLQVIQENKLNINVMLGIWLHAEMSNHETCQWLTEAIPENELMKNRKKNKLEIQRGIMLAKQYQEIIIAVNVGNEVMVDWNDHKVHTDTIISYVREIKKSIEQPITVADNYQGWIDHGRELAYAVDFISIHIYPVWEGKEIEQGLSYSIDNFLAVKEAFPDRKIVITEAGWPSIASEFGSRANEDKQLQYYFELQDWAKNENISVFFFEAFDEVWKGDPNNLMGAEKHWGLYDVNRNPKKIAQEIIYRKNSN